MPTRLYGKQRVNANKQKKAAKGKANKENESRCCVTYCENMGHAGPCGHSVCEECLFKLLHVSKTAVLTSATCRANAPNGNVFFIKCPVCRKHTGIPEEAVKLTMAAQCPGHTAEMQDENDNTFTVEHKACKHGCHNCPVSTLVVTAKTDYVDEDLLETIVFALHEDGARHRQITLHMLRGWMLAMFPVAAEMEEDHWHFVPDNLLPEGMRVAYLNAYNFMEFYFAGL